jgi:beta-ribofuranosylaminobenzene 5'-phosphate synthase
MATVSTGARLHFGFLNLSLAYDRLYGGVGVALDEPRATVRARPAAAVDCDDPAVEQYLDGVVEQLGVSGASVTVEERFPRHVGLGSGTQLALAVLVAVARAYDREVSVRECAPALGRGGRSGVGVATFERGGFVVDAGHPTERFTSAPPATGEWTVPPVVARHSLPAESRFVLVIPDAEPGPSGDREDTSMRTVVERADPGIAAEISTLATQRLLPAAATGDVDRFGGAVDRLGRLNGAWYADEQGGVYRPPAGVLVDRLSDSPAVSGVGQSSWGPTVYGVTTVERVAEATSAAREALSDAGVEGTVRTAAPREEGATVDG